MKNNSSYSFQGKGAGKQLLVSACLCGFPCRYNVWAGGHPYYLALYRQGLAVPVCPEVMGGLSIPRLPCEIRNGRVVNQEGEDMTSYFEAGAVKTLEQGLELGISIAVLKDKSPSCGSSLIYDGSFTQTLIKGEGVTAALLRKNGFFVYSDEDDPAAITAKHFAFYSPDPKSPCN